MFTCQRFGLEIPPVREQVTDYKEEFPELRNCGLTPFVLPAKPPKGHKVVVIPDYKRLGNGGYPQAVNIMRQSVKKRRPDLSPRSTEIIFTDDNIRLIPHTECWFDQLRAVQPSGFFALLFRTEFGDHVGVNPDQARNMLGLTGYVDPGPFAVFSLLRHPTVMDNFEHNIFRDCVGAELNIPGKKPWSDVVSVSFERDEGLLIDITDKEKKHPHFAPSPVTSPCVLRS